MSAISATPPTTPPTTGARNGKSPELALPEVGATQLEESSENKTAIDFLVDEVDSRVVPTNFEQSPEGSPEIVTDELAAMLEHSGRLAMRISASVPETGASDPSPTLTVISPREIFTQS